MVDSCNLGTFFKNLASGRRPFPLLQALDGQGFTKTEKTFVDNSYPGQGSVLALVRWRRGQPLQLPLEPNPGLSGYGGPSEELAGPDRDGRQCP
jgi:hypothetical protein